MTADRWADVERLFHAACERRADERAAFLTQVGALQTGPILIAVITAFLTAESVKYLFNVRKQSSATAAKQEPNGPDTEG